MRALVMLTLAIGVVALGLVADPQDKVVFLDVGQGDAILLQDGSGQVLIDGGQGMQVLERLAEEMPWFDRTIELVVLTHPQRDHMEGLIHVLDRYDVGMVLLPRAASESLLQEVWLQRLVDNGVPFRFAWRGQRVTIDSISMHILGPFDMPVAHAAAKKNNNNASVIMRVDVNPTQPPLRKGRGDRLSLLLTGDAERQVEYWLTKSTQAEMLDVDILKAGHHGSKTSTTQRILDSASTSAVVISVGADNRFGHPHKSVTQRLKGVPVYRTDEMGSVRFVFSDGSWNLSCGNSGTHACHL